MGGEKKDAFAKSEALLQAVLLADSYERTFRPISLEQPKALMPLANVPMIDYSLEFLASNGVEEIFIFCGWLGEKVKAYVDQSRWKDSEHPIIHVMQSSNATNACDALRELDGRDVLRSDPFILLNGDVVSNVRLKPILDAHKARRKNKENGGTNNVMTMVFSRVDQVHNRIRPLDEELVVVLDHKSKRILKYENNLNLGRVHLSTGELFDEYAAVEYRYNLLDCNIDICSQEMVNQIAENYDYKDLRRDYVRNEVQNRELDYRIHAHELVSPSDYACRVRCLRTYDAISRDVLRRWLYPLVPDANWLTEDTSYTFERGFRYRDSGVTLHRSSKVGEDTMIGSGTVIEEEAIISRSIIGAGCRIGKGAKVEGSYIWPGSVIEEGATVTSAVICDGVTVRKGATISRGCILSFNVVVGEGITIEPFTRIATCTEEDVIAQDADSDFGDFLDDETETEEAEAVAVDSKSQRSGHGSSIELRHDPALVGKDGLGIRCSLVTDKSVPQWAQESMKEIGVSQAEFAQFCGGIGCTEFEETRQHIWDDLGDLLLGEEDEAELEMEIEGGQQTDEERLLQFVSELIRGAGAQPDHDSIVLELNSQKFALNRTFEDLMYSAIPTMLGDAASESINAAQAKSRICGALDKWYPSITKLCVSVVQEIALVTAFEILCLYGPQDAGQIGLKLATAEGANLDGFEIDDTMDHARAAFLPVLTHMVAKELVSAQAVVAWSERSGAGLSMLPRKILDDKSVQVVIASFAAESSEDEDSDSDESSTE